MNGATPPPTAQGPTPLTDPTLLTNATLATGALVDVALADGRIIAVTPAARTPPAGVHLDLSGRLLLPAPAEPHAHFDKVLTGSTLVNARGDLAGAVAAWYAHRPRLPRAEIRDRALRAAYELLTHGITAVRTHVDVGTATRLVLLEAMFELRDALAGLLDLQIAAFVDLPVRGRAGAGNLAALVDALSAGADLVGGSPYRDDEPEVCLRLLLETAAAHGRPMDLHTDETLDPDVDTVRTLAELVRATGFPHQVTASHCVSLGMQAPERQDATAEALAAAGIGVVTCPLTNLYLHGRDHGTATPRGLTAIARLRRAGVRVAAGGDNVRDPFNPMGRGDPLETASLLVTAGHLRPEDAYESVSDTARAVMGLPTVRIEAGAPADLLAIRAGSVTDALARADPDRLVFHAGRLVSRTSVHRWFSTPRGADVKPDQQ